MSHTYVAPGGFTVSATATDPSGNTSLTVSASVSITTVAMEADPANSSLTALYVGGTTGNDDIAITPVSASGGVKVGINSVSYGPFSPTGHVIVYGQSGNDIIKTAAQTFNGVLTYVNVPLLIFAGSGNNTLNVSGSTAGNVLVGGGGSNQLIGGQGRDILIAGAGQSTLQAGNPPSTNLAQGGAILIGGTTDFDTNAAALASILAEWGSTSAYMTRIDHIMGTLSGGLNGTNFLNSTTVHDNGKADTLMGGTGMDWFFAGMMDVLKNKTPDETVTTIM
jgi:Ca2+-binding RTX toxin-like protein